MADATDVILHLSSKQWSSAVQAERQLASLTAALLVAAAVLQASIAVLGFGPASLLPASVIVALGIYGAIASRRYARRFRAEMIRFRALARRLDELTPDAGLIALEQGPADEPSRGPSLARIAYAGLMALGAINAVLAVL